MSLGNDDFNAHTAPEHQHAARSGGEFLSKDACDMANKICYLFSLNAGKQERPTLQLGDVGGYAYEIGTLRGPSKSLTERWRRVW